MTFGDCQRAIKKGDVIKLRRAIDAGEVDPSLGNRYHGVASIRFIPLQFTPAPAIGWLRALTGAPLPGAKNKTRAKTETGLRALGQPVSEDARRAFRA